MISGVDPAKGDEHMLAEAAFVTSVPTETRPGESLVLVLSCSASGFLVGVLLSWWVMS